MNFMAIYTIPVVDDGKNLKQSIQILFDFKGKYCKNTSKVSTLAITAEPSNDAEIKFV